MKVLFTGIGSIGSRHIQNLAAVCSEKGIALEIDVLRRSNRALPDEIKKLIHREINSDDNPESFYDVVFITDETRTHYENIVRFKEKCRHMFIEKPVLDSVEYGLEDIVPDDSFSVYYVACPIRFSNYYKAIKNVVDNQTVYSARIIFSSYMPNWQKGRDYRNSFRCFTERGGGVDIDSLHEIDYMKELFGMPSEVNRVAGKFSDLEMDACDIATYIFTYTDKIVEMHLDYFGRANNRRIELFTKEDVIIIDFNKKTIEKQVHSEVEMFDSEDPFYLNEMNYFVELIHSKGSMDNKNTVQNSIESLKLAKGIL